MQRYFQISLLSVLSLFLLACASIAPERDRPEEVALSPAPLASWLGLQGLTQENRMVPLNLGASGLHWRVRALRAATRSIDLQTFIWKADGVGLALVREVVAAAERGVRVRVLLDDSFLVHADAALHALSQHANISYRIYNPAARRGGGLALRELENIYDFARINHRMHNKLMVVDGRIAIMGGRNLADEYYGYETEHNFRDFELLLSGPFISELSEVFDLYWNDPWSLPIEDLQGADGDWSYAAIDAWLQGHATKHLTLTDATPTDWAEVFSKGLPAEIQLLVDTPPDSSPDLDMPVQLAREIVARMDEVERDMILVSAYFIPTEPLMDAIERATARGVRVRILTNSLGANNHVSAHAAYAAQRPALLKAGAELYELRADAGSRHLYLDPAVTSARLGLHAKGALFDECCLFVGSANLDPRSLRLNTEIGLLIDSPPLNSRLRQLLATDLMPANAWKVELDERGNVLWIGPKGEQGHTPPASFYLRAESWFFGLLPIEGQM
jgi:putative cardiolipin synthase